MIFYLFLISFIFLLLYASPINSWGFGSKQHDEITRSAFPFLNPVTLDKVVSAILSQDEGLTDFSLQKLLR
jgi:hypothetical protein